MHDGDRLRRQLGRRVELGDGRIIPGFDLAHEDLCECRAVDDEVAGLDSVDVHHRHDPAHHHRELNETTLVELLARQRRVGGAEGHGLGLDLLDAAAGTDRLVVQPDIGLLLIGIGPFRINRIGEGRAGARDVEGESGCNRRCGDKTGSRQGAEKFQGFLSCLFETIVAFVRDETSSRRGNSPTADVLASLVLVAGVCLTLRPG
jgi:hypothetical protein